MSEIRLTQLSHGGGCGCKIAPAMLESILKSIPKSAAFPNLLVGNETADDAAVYRLNDEQALVATTDFFMPIVDDPFDFGRIAATNAISDIYAMGGTPIMALAIACMPVDTLPLEDIQKILQGGASVCAAAGIPLAGGHTIDAPEPIYGLMVMGLVHPDKIKRNHTAKAGDALILCKPLGVGILGSAMKKGVLDAAGYRQLIDTTTQLNKVGIELAELAGVHAMTDVTGFGLLGHLLEVCRGAKLGASIQAGKLPVLSSAIPLARQGIGPGAIGRNLSSFGETVVFAQDVAGWQRSVLADAQTSGGLLLCVAPEAVEEVMTVLHWNGYEAAAVIGELSDGDVRVKVEA